MKDKPVIAVTGPQHGGIIPWLMTRHAIRRAGGKAVRLHTGRYTGDLDFDGLVVGGGSDISPEHYGAELVDIIKEPESRPLGLRLQDLFIFILRLIFSIKLRQPEKDPERDKMEKTLIKQGMERQIPILGICRGEQMLNVTLGGTLHQRASEFYTETPDIQSIRPVKIIDIARNSRLESIVENPTLRVNALHSQAVDKLGEGLRVCARDKNGIVQAIEAAERDFVIGVQWHPEYLPGRQAHQRLFHRLVESAIKHKQQRRG